MLSQAYLATFKHKYHIHKHVQANNSAEQITYDLIIESFTIKLFKSNSVKLSLNVVTENKVKKKCLGRRKNGQVNDLT